MILFAVQIPKYVASYITIIIFEPPPPPEIFIFFGRGGDIYFLKVVSHK